MDANAKWITGEKFYTFEPNTAVFHKELDKYKPEYDEELMNSHILFRNSFELDNTENCSIHISADDYYRLYINGSFVCSGPAPGYPWRYYYNDVDISGYVKKGKNVIAVHTFYQGLVNRVWVSGDRQHGMICQIFSDDTAVLSSDGSFKCAEHSAFGVYDVAVKRHDTIFNEVYDSNSKMIGFEAPEFDDSDWQYCKERVVTDYTLFRQNTPPLVYYNIKPKTVKKDGTKVFVDIGREIIGYLCIKAHGNKNDVVTVRYAEELDSNGRPRHEMRCNCTYADKWILSGGNDAFHHFDYKGFRYAEILLTEGCVIDDITVCVRHLPFDCKTTLKIDDKVLSDIWELCKNTIKYGSQECFVDCPTREKGQYLGDVSISALSYAILTQNAEPLKKSIIDFGESSKICSGLMAVSTSSFMQEIADFSLLYPYMLLWYHHLTSDVTLLKDTVKYVDGLLDYFKKYERSDGLICGVTEKWNLVDWPENLRDGYEAPITRPIGDVCHNVINAFYIGAMKCASKIYELVGRARINTEKYEAAFIREFYNSDTCLFTDCAETAHSALHSNVLPLLFNIGINDKTKCRIVDLIAQKGLSSCGTYFSYFVLQAVKNTGNKKLVLQLLKDEKAWLNMLSEGATTTYEAWGKEQKKNTSLFHPWSTCPIIILFDMEERSV